MQSSMSEDVSPPEIAHLQSGYHAPTLTVRDIIFVWGSRTYLMGIINVTPDSFSGDGTGGNPTRAADLASRLTAEGASIIDVGAESSRPGAEELSPAEECRRLLPSLRAVRAVTKAPVSVDTYHPEVARAALDEGADIINDIHGLRRYPEMARLAAERCAPVVAMHNQRGLPDADVIEGVAGGFEATLQAARKASLAHDRIILDPGFGFGWTPRANLAMVRRLPELRRFRLPLLIGPSRKSTIGAVLDLPVEERFEGTAALVALAIAGGADIVRVHDVARMARVARMTDAVVRDNWSPSPGP